MIKENYLYADENEKEMNSGFSFSFPFLYRTVYNYSNLLFANILFCHKILFNSFESKILINVYFFFSRIFSNCIASKFD